MDLFTAIVLLFVGIAVFLVGMRLMSGGMQKSSGPTIRRLFKKTQNSRLAGAGIGAAVTALIQSSDATSVMAIGFINAGVMSCFQGLAVIMGACLGTTITGLLVSLSSLSISNYLMLLAFVGIAMTFIHNRIVKNIGEILAGLGVLFFGLEALKQAFGYTDIQSFCTSMFASVNFPPLLLLIGFAVTALVQSSSATTGIVIVMVGTGALTFEKGLYLAMGATIGTIVTTMIAALDGTTNAKRTAVTAFLTRVAMGVIGLVVVWIAASPISSFFTTVFPNTNEMAVAVFMIIYNVIYLIIFLPFLKPIVRLGELLIKDKAQEKLKASLKFIDLNMRRNPSVAVMQVKREIEHMADLAHTNLGIGFNMMMDLDLSREDELNDREDQIDYINNAITNFLIEISPNAEGADEKAIGSYFHVINDIERIGDHAANFLTMAKKMKDDELAFSATAQEEFRKVFDVVERMYALAVLAFEEHHGIDVAELHALEEESDRLKEELDNGHYERLKAQTCKVELAPFYSSLNTELERVADHLTNVGYSFINPTGDDEPAKAK